MARFSASFLLLLALCGSVLGFQGARAHVAGSESAKDGSAPPVTLHTVVSGTYQEIHGYAESVLGTGVVRSAAESAVLFLESFLGQENVYNVAMFFEMVIRFLAEGAASGLNVITVYVTEILRVTGFDAALVLPKFTPEGITAFVQWGLLALIGYWVLIVVLRVLFAVLKRVLWVVRTVLALWFFGLIVADKTASADATAVRLGGLVLVCALLTLISSTSEKSYTVEQRLGRLEGRLKVVEKRKGDQ